MITPARKRTLSLLTNPFFLAAVPTIALVFSIPVIKQPYLLDLISTERIIENNYWSYHDLDGDGKTEKISSFDFPNGSGITISKDALILNQWNITGTFGFSGKSVLHIPADCNGDGMKELYLFSISGDSILLHSVPDPENPALGISNRLVDITGPGRTIPDPKIVQAEPQDLDGDGKVELLFGITSGFSKYPRKIYAYYPGKDSLVSSPPLGGFILSIVQADLNGDGFCEIMPSEYASENISPSETRHHDHSAWCIVLDRNLRPLFEPIEVRGNLASATPMILETQSGKIHDFLVCTEERDSSASLVSFNINGEISARTRLSVMSHTSLMTQDRKSEPVYALSERDRGIVLYKSDRKYDREILMPGSPRLIQEDIDLDGTDEIIVISQETGRVFVYRSGFRRPVVAGLGSEFNGEALFSVIRTPDEPPCLFLQTGTSQFRLAYRKNPLYYLSFGLHPLIYAAFIAFVLLIQNTQKRVLLRREEERKKITELQLSLIRNQLDPHFTLNALNSVLNLVEHSDREQARDSLINFSALYRELLLSASKSRRTLAEELEFCRGYLALERMRYMNRFDFVIDLQHDINDELPVPKLVIQLFAENSVKHGLAGMEMGGLLEIIVRGTGNELTICVRDNGIGRTQAATDHGNSTGKGLKLMNELFELCNRYFDDKYSFTVTDLVGKNGISAGTQVSVTIIYRHDSVTII